MSFNQVQDEKNLYYGTLKSSNILADWELNSAVDLINTVENLSISGLEATQTLIDIHDFLYKTSILFKQSNFPNQAWKALEELEISTHEVLKEINAFKHSNLDNPLTDAKLNEDIVIRLNKSIQNTRIVFDDKVIKDYYRSMLKKKKYYYNLNSFNLNGYQIKDTATSDRYISKSFENIKESYRKIENHINKSMDFLEYYFDSLTNKQFDLEVENFLEDEFNAKAVWEFFGFDPDLFEAEESIEELRNRICSSEKEWLGTKNSSEKFAEKKKSIIEFITLNTKLEIALNINTTHNNAKNGVDLFAEIIADRLKTPMLKFDYNKESNGIYAYNETINFENVEKLINNIYNEKDDVFNEIEFATLRTNSSFDPSLPIDLMKNDFIKAKKLFEALPNNIKSLIQYKLMANLYSIIPSKQKVQNIEELKELLEKQSEELNPHKPLQVQVMEKDNEFALFVKTYSLNKINEYSRRNMQINNFEEEQDAEEPILENDEINPRNILSFKEQIIKYNEHLKLLSRLAKGKANADIFSIHEEKNKDQVQLAKTSEEDISLYKQTFSDLIIFKTIRNDSIEIIPSSRILIKESKIGAGHNTNFTLEDLDTLCELGKKGTFLVQNLKQKHQDLNNDIQHLAEESAKIVKYRKITNSDRPEKYEPCLFNFKGQNITLDIVNGYKTFDKDFQKLKQLANEEYEEIKQRSEEISKQFAPITSALISSKVSFNKFIQYGEGFFRKHLNELLQQAYLDIVVALFGNEETEFLQAKHFNKSRQLKIIYGAYSSCVSIEKKDRECIEEAIAKLKTFEALIDIDNYPEYLKISYGILHKMQEIQIQESKTATLSIKDMKSDKMAKIERALKIASNHLIAKNIFSTYNSIFSALNQVEHKRITYYGEVIKPYNTASDWLFETIATYLKMHNKVSNIIKNNIKETPEKTINGIKAKIKNKEIELTEIERECLNDFETAFKKSKNSKFADLTIADFESIQESPYLSEITKQEPIQKGDKCKKVYFNEAVDVRLYGEGQNIKTCINANALEKLNKNDNVLGKRANKREILLGLLSLTDIDNGEFFQDGGEFTKAAKVLAKIYDLANKSEYEKNQGKKTSIELNNNIEKNEKDRLIHSQLNPCLNK